jgi:cell division protein FtsZ
MTIKLQLPKLTHLRPRITVVGVGGAGSNAVNNMISSGLTGVNFVVANTDAQSLANSAAEHHIQLGAILTEGLGAGARPEIGKAAAEEAIEEIRAKVAGSHMVFVAAGMGGGTGTGAAAVIARVARECGALTVGVVTKPFHFEGTRRMRAAEAGIAALKPEVDTLIVIPNQNLFRIANERTTFAEAFVLADQVLYSGIACVVDLIVKEGLINLDFADVRTIMSGMGTAMMGTGEAAGEKRAVVAAEEAISNPLLDDISLRGAKGLLISITGGRDLKLYEVDEAAQRVRQEIDGEANIIVGATFDDTLGDKIRVSIVASGMERLGESEGSQSATRGAYESAPPLRPTAVPPPPAPLDLQPPFIEPYPDPYDPQAAQTAQPHHASAPAPEQVEAEHVSASAPVPAQGQSGVGHPDFARALSEALEPAQAAAPAAWVSAEGGAFQDAPAQVGTDPLASLNLGHAARNSGGAPTFYPQPPQEAHRTARRLPEVQDFPIVGQREYHAKADQYAGISPPPVPPRAFNHPPATSERPERAGFFARLFGRKRKSKAERSSATHYPQAKDGHLASHDAVQQRIVQTPRGAQDVAAKDAGDPYELPAFFGSERK